MIPYLKPYSPSRQELDRRINAILDKGIYTNFGPLQNEFEEKLADYLGVDHVACVANGTLALQLAFKIVNMPTRVITTPFSFIATLNSLKWERHSAEFNDIDIETFNLPARSYPDDPEYGYLPVHVFGCPCSILPTSRSPVVIDASHAFGVKKNGTSIFANSCLSVASLHATKILHSVEGGMIVCQSKEQKLQIRELSNFGLRSQTPVGLGINAKFSEFHAAVGLVNLQNFDNILSERQSLFYEYISLLKDMDVTLQKWEAGSIPNGSYMPVVLPATVSTEAVQLEMMKHGVQTRRYFFPSLSNIERKKICRNSEIISEHILCLPLYNDLSIADVHKVCAALNKALERKK